MSTKPKKPIHKKYTLTLNECEWKRLRSYADSNGIDRPVALHRIVSQALRSYANTESSTQPNSNQLGLFDTVQIDIFNNAQRVTRAPSSPDNNKHRK